MPDAGRHGRQRDVLPATGVALLRHAVRDTRGTVFVYREPPDPRHVDDARRRLVSQPGQEAGGVHAADGSRELLRVPLALSAPHLLHRDRARRADRRDRLRHVLLPVKLLQDYVLFE